MESTERFFWLIGRINDFNSLSIFRDRWLRMTSQKWYDDLSLEDKLELHKIKGKKKEELLAEENKRKEVIEYEIVKLKDSPDGKILSENSKAYMIWISVITELELRSEIEKLKARNEYVENNKEAITLDNVSRAIELGLADSQYFNPAPYIYPVPEPTTKETDQQLTEKKKNIKKYFRLKGLELEKFQDQFQPRRT